MQFPRINAAINLTLLYYNKHQIANGVGILSKFFQPVKYTFNDKELPSWHQMVLNSHEQMEQEINDIINLNYPHVRAIVFENLRERLTDVRIKSLNKEWIIRISDENNETEIASLAARNNRGFAVTINKDFLPDYFEIVENALSNFRRIVNKYLNLYDAGKLPSAYPMPDYIPVTPPVLSNEDDKLETTITGEQLALLFKLLDEVGVFKYKQKIDMQKFVFNNIKPKTESKNFKYFINKFSDPEKAAKDYWIDKLPEMLKFIKTKL